MLAMRMLLLPNRLLVQYSSILHNHCNAGTVTILFSERHVKLKYVCENLSSHSGEYKSTFLPARNTHTHTHTTCCHITNGYNKNNYHFLMYNFSKEQCTLPEDDLRIETCRSLLNILM